VLVQEIREFQAVKKYRHLFGDQRYHTVLNDTTNGAYSKTNQRIHLIKPICSILILSFRILGILTSDTPAGFRTKILYEFLIEEIRAACRQPTITVRIWPQWDLMLRTNRELELYNWPYQLRAALNNAHHAVPHPTSFSITLPISPCSQQTLISCCSRSVTDQVTHPYKSLLLQPLHSKLDPDNSVGIANRYGMDGPGIEFRWGRDFPHPSRQDLGPIYPPIQWVPGLSRRVKRPGCGVDHPPHVAPRLKQYFYSPSGPTR
jgi:hypothetical protein